MSFQPLYSCIFAFFLLWGCVDGPGKQNEKRNETLAARAKKDPRINDSDIPIISGQLPKAAKAGTPYFYQFNKSNNEVVFTALNLPSALRVAPNGAISAQFNRAATYRDIYIIGKFEDQKTTLGPFTITVAPPSLDGPSLPNIGHNQQLISGSLPPKAYVGTFFTYTFKKHSWQTLFSATGLPSWATYNPSSSTISGTPKASTGGESLSITVKGTLGSKTTVLGPFQLKVIYTRQQIIDMATFPSTPPIGSVNHLYTYPITLKNNAVKLSMIGLPSWAVFNSQNLTITGTPSRAGRYSGAKIYAEIDNQKVLLSSPVFVINPAENQGPRPVVTPPPRIINPSPSISIKGIFPLYLAQGQSIEPIEFEDRNNNQTEFTQEGLPTGLFINSSSGAITGVPTSLGLADKIYITATLNQKTKRLGPFRTLIVSPTDPRIGGNSNAPNIFLSNSFPQEFTQGEEIDSIQINDGGRDETQFSATGLPPGLQLDQTSGLISGTPSTPGTYNVTLIGTRNDLTQNLGPFQTTVHISISAPEALNFALNPLTDCSSSSNYNSSDPLSGYAWHIFNSGQKSFAGLCGTVFSDLNVLGAWDKNIKGRNVTILISDSGLEKTHLDLKDNLAPDSFFKNYRSNDNALSSSNDTHHLGPADTSPCPHTIEDHGTMVAGIAASTNNTIGSLGVAPLAKLGAKNWLTEALINGQSSFKYASNLNYLDQANGDYDIFNYSWGESFSLPASSPQSIVDARNDDFRNIISSRSLNNKQVFLMASGNESDLQVDSCFDQDHTNPHLIVVSAFNNLGAPSSYSTSGSCNWIAGAGGEYGADDNFYQYYKNFLLNDPNNPLNLDDPSNASIKTSILAPSIIATDISGCLQGFSRFFTPSAEDGEVPENSFDAKAPAGGTENYVTIPGNSDCDYTARMNGTSAATPTISGIVALLKEANGNLSTRDIKHILAHTAKKPLLNITGPLANPNDLPDIFNSNYTLAYGWVKNSYGLYFSKDYGFGIADGTKAALMALNWKNNNNFTLPPYLQHTQSSDQNLDASIPTNDLGGATSDIILDIASNFLAEEVEVEVSLEHPNIFEIAIELVSPAGTKSVLMHSMNYFLPFRKMDNFRFLSNAFYGEPASGTWTIKVIDPFNGHFLELPEVIKEISATFLTDHMGDDNPPQVSGNGRLKNWKITIHGHRKK